jgi:hypothetical protein
MAEKVIDSVELTPLDLFAFQALMFAIPSDLRMTIEGIEQAYEVARMMLAVRQRYEQVVKAETKEIEK